jgi:predicted transposase YdaD
MKKDTISKELIKRLIVKDISKYILGIELEEFEFIDKEFERIESRRADIVLNVKDEYILHIELQSSYDSKMAYRMLRYYLDIREITKLPIKQYLINLSNQNMKNYIKESKIEYSFEYINIKELDCNYFLNTDSPDAIVLAILCDFKDKKPIEISKNILLKLHQLLDDKEFRRYVLMLEEISELRNLKNTIKEAEVGLMSIRWEDLPSYEIGMERGFQDGIQKGLETGKIVGLYEFGIPIVEIAKKYNKSEDEIKAIIFDIKDKKE